MTHHQRRISHIRRGRNYSQEEKVEMVQTRHKRQQTFRFRQKKKRQTEGKASVSGLEDHAQWPETQSYGGNWLYVQMRRDPTITPVHGTDDDEMASSAMMSFF